MMMKEIALHILDIAENSVSAGANLIQIAVSVDTDRDWIQASVRDNGCGMSEQLKEQVQDPFCTSRTTRKVGLGIPFFKSGALMCEGTFKLESEVGVGTYIEASYQLSHIDRPPLGNMADTMLSIVVCNLGIDFVYSYTVNGENFTFDTREIREALGQDIPLNTPDVIAWMRACLDEGIEEINQQINGGVSI